MNGLSNLNNLCSLVISGLDRTQVQFLKLSRLNKTRFIHRVMENIHMSLLTYLLTHTPFINWPMFTQMTDVSPFYVYCVRFVAND